MARRQETPAKTSRRRAPATTPEARETQIVADVYDLAHRQVLEGTVSSQVMTHFLKMGTEREALEKERLQNENLLLQAKIEQIKSGERIEELYKGAIDAMQMYQGRRPDDT